ncbi:uncharacterized protein LOC135389924 [Ornithodoros turicata]|uniref:uncharacterized protein LOC135389924 n=1 Tax=Ornithodoros turicata TaxID=34597 RepID=UPI00313A3967
MGTSVKWTDIRVKLKAIAYYRSVGNKSLTAKMFGVSDKTIANWIKGEHRLRAEGPSKIRRCHAESVALLERSMLRYVNDRSRRGKTIRYDELVEHAAELKKAHKVRGLPVSLVWVTEFVTRHHLRSKCEKLKPSTPQSTPKTDKAPMPSKAKTKKEHRTPKAQTAIKKAASKCLKAALKGPNKLAQKKAGLVINLPKKKHKTVNKNDNPKKKGSVHAGTTTSKKISLPKSNLKKVIALSKKVLSKAKTKSEDKQKLIPHAEKKMGQSPKRATPKKSSKPKSVQRPKNPIKPKSTVSAAKQSLRRAKLLACRTKESTSSAASRATCSLRTAVAQKLHSAKQMKRRRQPTKIFRTRYRIKEMQRRIEENRASDFFDFFYGLGLIPVSKDPDDSWCYPLLNSVQLSPCSSFPSMSDTTLPLAPREVPQSPTSPRTRRYLAWRPRPSLVTPPPKDCDMVQRTPGGFIKQEPGPSSSEDNGPSQLSLLQQTKSFFERIQSGSLQSENAVSPGESPIIPEQLAVVKQLFPASKRLKIPSIQKSPSKFSPVKSDARPCPNLRPRSTEQLQRLAGCFSSPRKRKSETPPKLSPEVLYCTSPKAMNWLSFPDRSEPQKSVLTLEGHALMQHLRDVMGDVEDSLPEPKAKKEHFEEGVNLSQDLQRICRRRSYSKNDVPQGDCFQELSQT